MINAETSFCKSDLMSVCTACSPKGQRNCWFYVKSSATERCMYFVFDEFCDCPDAQKKARSEAGE